LAGGWLLLVAPPVVVTYEEIWKKQGVITAVYVSGSFRA
jgi:hypothetical protein